MDERIEDEVKNLVTSMDKGGIGKRRSVDGRLTFKLCEEDDNDVYVDESILSLVRRERDRIYSFVEDVLIGTDDKLLGDLSNIIYDKEI